MVSKKSGSLWDLFLPAPFKVVFASGNLILLDLTEKRIKTEWALQYHKVAVQKWQVGTVIMAKNSLGGAVKKSVLLKSQLRTPKIQKQLYKIQRCLFENPMMKILSRRFKNPKAVLQNSQTPIQPTKKNPESKL